MTNEEKMRKILATPVGRIPCDEKCTNCPIGKWKRCGDDVAYKRARQWLKKNGYAP
jgi:hypothetical protein